MWRKTILVSACAWLTLGANPSQGAAEATVPPQQLYLQIYLKINDADHLEQQGDLSGALVVFRDCYARLGKLKKRFPHWEEALVYKRTLDVKERVAELEARVPDTTAATPAVSTPAISPEDASALRRRVTDLEGQVQDYKDRFTRSQEQVTSLQSQLEIVNRQIATFKSGGSMTEQLNQVLSQNAELKQQLDSIKVDPKSKVAIIQAQLKNAQDKLAASESANEVLRQTVSSLKQQIDGATAQLNEANRKLAATDPTSSGYSALKHENEVLRAILSREVQDQARRDQAKRLAQEELDKLKIDSKVLQERLDVLGSPMTPAATDEERNLLLSLRGPNLQVAPIPGNVTNQFSAAAIPAATPGSLPAPAGTPLVESVPSPGSNAAAPAATPSAAPVDGSTPLPAPAQVAAAATATPPPAIPAPSPSEVSFGPPPADATPTRTVPAVASTQIALFTPPAPSGSSLSDSAGKSDAPPSSGSSSPAPAPTKTVDEAPLPPSSSPLPTALEPSGASAPTPSEPPTRTQLPPAETVEKTITVTTTRKADAAQAEPAQFAPSNSIPDDVRDLAEQAKSLFDMKRYDESAAKYEQFVDKHPESIYGWSNLGIVRYQQQQLPQALRALQQAVKLNPSDAFSYSNLGIVYYQMSQFDSAIDSLERAIALDPHDAKSHNFYGCACFQKGWQEVAEQEFRKAIEIQDTFADAHFNLAMVYALQKPPSLELARHHYNRALELGIAKDPRLDKLLK